MIEPFGSEHRAFSDFVVISPDKDLGIIPGWRCPPKGQREWVSPIGELRPIWKEVETVNYEYWPVFDGVEKNVRHCETVALYAGKAKVMKYKHVKCSVPKWEQNYIWYFGGKEQDTVTRGANKGKGKYKRVKMGTSPSSRLKDLKGVGLIFFYAQLIMGDAVDYYCGINGLGKKAALELLDGVTTEEELFRIVKNQYQIAYGESKGLSRMLESGRLAWLQTYKGELWNFPENSQEGSFPLLPGQ